MKQEDKELLLKDLCARLPYGVKFASFSESMKNHSDSTTLRQIYYNRDCNANNIQGDDEDNISTIIELMKPYLRPMSSMTEEEKHTMADICLKYAPVTNIEGLVSELLKFYNANHLDYNGLIEKGLALEAPEGMYEVQD